MTDLSAFTQVEERPHTRPRRASLRGEYYTYFAVIFMATLLPACVTWALTALRQRRLPEKGPIRRAWSQANIITPIIFSA